MHDADEEEKATTDMSSAAGVASASVPITKCRLGVPMNP